MEFCARIHIRVKSVGTWEKLKDIDTEDYGFFRPAKELFDLSDLDFTGTSDDWSVDGGTVHWFVREVAEALQGEGIVIADSSNIDVDDNIYCVYYIGKEVKSQEFYGDSDKAEWHVFPDNIVEWLNFGEFALDRDEVALLESLGLTGIKNIVE